MQIDMTWMMLSLVTSGAGFVLLTYGRKTTRVPHLVAGVALMVYPYFTPSVTSLLVVGALIGVALYAAVALDW